MNVEVKVSFSGKSMWPLFSEGDIGLFCNHNTDLKYGDIVLIENSQGKLIVHQLIEYRYKGLRNKYFDDEVFGDLTYKGVLSEVYFVDGKKVSKKKFECDWSIKLLGFLNKKNHDLEFSHLLFSNLNKFWAFLLRFRLRYL